MARAGARLLQGLTDMSHPHLTLGYSWLPSACLPARLMLLLVHPPAESYAALSRQQVALVAEEACRAHASLIQRIKRMAEEQPLPEPSY